MEEQRKVQLTGNSTFIVSLPRAWAERNGVGRGSALYVGEDEAGNLLLSPRKTGKGKTEYVIEAMKGGDLTLRKIISCYVAGADTIVVKGEGAGAAAEEARRKLSGLEIVEEEKDEIKLRIIDFGDELDVDKLIEREFKVTHKMLKLTASVFEGNLGAMEEVKERERDVDRLYLLLLRRFIVRPGGKRSGIFKVLAAKIMERIGDHTEHVCRVGRKVVSNKHAVNAIEKTAEAYSSVAMGFLEKTGTGNELQKIAVEIEKERTAWMSKAPKNKRGDEVMQSVFDECIRITRFFGDLSELGMNLTTMEEGTGSVQKDKGAEGRIEDKERRDK